MDTRLIVILILILTIPLSWWLLFRRRTKSFEPFPEQWRRILEKEVKFYGDLDADARKAFERDVQEFLDDVAISGVGIEIDDTDRLLVASSAVIPVLAFPEWKYRNLNEVLLYPDTFNHDYDTAKGEGRNILGMVGEGSMQRMMILSQPALRSGFENTSSKQNVGIHEFVHLLDKSDGAIDGIPGLFLEHPYLIPWVKAMHKAINKIREGDSDINPYGSKNEAEFLSVVSEYFFKRPDLFREKHPELFDLLSKMFGNNE